VQHHIDSFNKFIDYGLQKIIDEQRIIETDIEDTYLKLGKIRVEHPVVKEADGAIEKLYPNEARLRNLSYSGPLYLEMSVVKDGVESEVMEAKIGQLPIMVNPRSVTFQDLAKAKKSAMGKILLTQGDTSLSAVPKEWL